MTLYKFSEEQEKKMIKSCLYDYRKVLELESEELQLTKIKARIGILLYVQEKYLESIKIFEAIAKPEKSPYYSEVTNSNLIELYIETLEFEKALELAPSIDFSNRRYSCGNAAQEDFVYNTLILTKIYLGLDNKEKALDYGLSYIFDPYSDKKLTTITYEFLTKEFDKPFLQKNLKKAIKNLTPSNKEKDNFKLTFLDREIELGWFTRSDIENAAELKLHLKKSLIYKLINS
jgi:tetratricopeptide (TPR) repeat protein